MDNDIIIETYNLTKQFGALVAVDNVSMKVRRNSLHAIIGPNGAGKTTFFNLLSGNLKPTYGKINYKGKDLTRLPIHRMIHFGIGRSFQITNIFPNLTVFENIAFPLTLNAVADNEKKRRVSELLERIGLADASRALPHELSGGEVQRVAVARALAHRPKLLLADEPTASLDSATGRNLINLMFAMGRESGCTMVLSTHDTEVMDLADQCIRIRDGMVQEGEGRRQ